MNDVNYPSDVEYESPKKKNFNFKLTRGMLILLVLAVIVIIAIIIIIVSHSKAQQEKFDLEDFYALESRMVGEMPNYIMQNGIKLTTEVIRVDLSELLVKNGGSIDPKKMPVVNICKGYTLLSKSQSNNDKYESYISCRNNDIEYITPGYINNDIKVTTTKKKKEKDKTKPEITIIGPTVINIKVGDEFKNPSVKAIDDVDGDISSKIKINGSVNTQKAGTYNLTYSVTDKSNNTAELTIKVNVEAVPITTVAPVTTTPQVQTSKPIVTRQQNPIVTRKPVQTTKAIAKTPPILTLRGSKTTTIYTGQTYRDSGYYAVDCYGTNITSSVVVKGNVNTSVSGTYYLTYSVTDRNGNTASTTRTVIVKSKGITSISITPVNAIIKVGETQKYYISYTPSNAENKRVTWSTLNNNGVVTIDSNGVVTAKKVGTATIKATTPNGVSATTTITVLKK